MQSLLQSLLEASKARVVGFCPVTASVTAGIIKGSCSGVLIHSLLRSLFYPLEARGFGIVKLLAFSKVKSNIST